MGLVKTLTHRTLTLGTLTIASFRTLTIRPLRAFPIVPVVALLLAGAATVGPAQAHDPTKATLEGLSPAARSLSGPPVGVGPKRSMWGRFHAIFGDAPAGSNVGGIA